MPLVLRINVGDWGAGMEHQDLIGSLGALPSSLFWYLHHEPCH